jgi:hypothetical protein
MALPLDPHKVLDQQFFAVMECVEGYLAAQEELSAVLKDGLFDIAKAKYTLGSLGQQCYPGDMHAAAVVHPQQLEQQSDNLFDQFSLSQQLQDCHMKAKALHTQQQGQELKQQQQPQQQLRQRRKDSQQQQDSQQLHQQGDEQPDPPSPTASSDDTHHQADPIAWFSALPPAALRSAQGHFRTALERAVAAANKVQQLRALLEDLVDTCSPDDGADSK